MSTYIRNTSDNRIVGIYSQLVLNLSVHLFIFPFLFLMYSLALPSALQLSLPFRISSSLLFKLFFTYLFEETGLTAPIALTSPCLHLYLSSIYPAIPILYHSFQLPSLHPYFLLLPSLHHILHFLLLLPSITPFIASSSSISP